MEPSERPTGERKVLPSLGFKSNCASPSTAKTWAFSEIAAPSGLTAPTPTQPSTLIVAANRMEVVRECRGLAMRSSSGSTGAIDGR
ncbi:hypothetical protein D3C86_1421340 [compost metagenome]